MATISASLVVYFIIHLESDLHLIFIFSGLFLAILYLLSLVLYNTPMCICFTGKWFRLTPSAICYALNRQLFVQGLYFPKL